ncbi:protein PFC0760c-like [Centruroides sculpturatus]|uniref:protein PFC0760c-like n=1 Tax=Centruroides sculpturatus TaxID=218467 RepID=UPI000C6E3BFA|nr:protein PFC0760c-like [Centruroides sculpturatus]
MEKVINIVDVDRDLELVLSEERFDPPDFSIKFSTNYDDDDDDSLSWDFESYQDTNYMKIVIDLAEDYFSYGDSNLQHVDKKDVYFRCDEYENHRMSLAQKVELQTDNDSHNKNPKYLCEEQLNPPNLRPTDYDNRDDDDFLSWDLESYRETDYMEIVLGLSEEYFGYSDFNSYQDYKENVYFRFHEYENHHVSSAQKVELKAVNDCLNRNIELLCEEKFHAPALYFEMEKVINIVDVDRDLELVLSEERFDPPDFSIKFSTNYDDDDDDSLSWDFESYQDTNYMKIVIDLAEDYFSYGDSNLQHVDKKDVYFRCDEYENHRMSLAQKVELQTDNDSHNKNPKYLCEEQLNPPNLRPTDYDNRDDDDFLSWDLESYRETNYMEIVLGLSEEYFGYSDFNSYQDYKENVYFRFHEYENHHVSSAQKVELKAVNDCLNRNIELLCEEKFHAPALCMKLQTSNDDRGDFLSWDMEGYEETGYSDIVLDLSEDCFNDNDCNSRQIIEKDVYICSDECENNPVYCDEKVQLEVTIEDSDRIIENTTSDVHVNQLMDHAPKKEKFSKLKKFFRFFF